MKYWRVYADAEGESHIEELTASFDLMIYAPPAPEIGVSNPTEATRYVFAEYPPNWDSPFHPAPRRQLLVMLSGHLQGEVSDGSVLNILPGDVLLMEDTTGKGHRARSLDSNGVYAMMVHLD